MYDIFAWSYANPNIPGVIYANTLLPGPTGYDLLDQAFEKLRDTFERSKLSVLWSLRYAQRCPSAGDSEKVDVPKDGGIIAFAESNVDLAFDDAVLEDVKRAWTCITGETSGFMQFEDRETGAYDDGDG